jgi:hypothetical protein
MSAALVKGLLSDSADSCERSEQQRFTSMQVVLMLLAHTTHPSCIVDFAIPGHQPARKSGALQDKALDDLDALDSMPRIVPFVRPQIRGSEYLPLETLRIDWERLAETSDQCLTTFVRLTEEMESVPNENVV